MPWPHPVTESTKPDLKGSVHFDTITSLNNSVPVFPFLAPCWSYFGTSVCIVSADCDLVFLDRDMIPRVRMLLTREEFQ